MEISAEVGTSNRLDWLDALRGWAILGVLLVHVQMFICTLQNPLLAEITLCGQFGVQLFFIISALTISITYDSHIAKYGLNTRSSISWFVKRFFRIAPLYYVAIAVQLLFSTVSKIHHPDAPFAPGLTAIFSNILFVHTWVPAGNNYVVPGGWSVGVEMFFYLLVPVIWNIKDPRNRAKCLALGIPVMLGLTLWVSHAHVGSWKVPNDTYFYFWFPTQYGVLAIGLIYYFKYYKLPDNMTLVKVVIRVGAACLALITGVACSFWLNLNAGLAPICMGTCFGLLIPFIRLHHPRLIVNGLMIYVGRLSYSIYLANMFVVMSLNYLLHEFFHIKVPQTAFPLCYLSFVTILCIVATATKKHIEDPMIDIGHALSSRMIQMEKRPESFCSTRG